MKRLLLFALVLFMTIGIKAQETISQAKDSTTISAKKQDNTSQVKDSTVNLQVSPLSKTQINSSNAQEYTSETQSNVTPTYLLFEFMQVKNEQGSDYIQVEQFWSGIHKQRVADKSILGWDLWSLTPSGTRQGAQYLTVTLFKSLEDMLQALGSLDVVAYAKKAYPDKSESDINALLSKTFSSRDMIDQFLIKQIDKTKDDFKMKVGTLASIDINKQLDESYEKVESEIFKPWHQAMVDKGKKGSWELLRSILPSGSNAWATHFSVSLYNDAAQLAAFLEGLGGDMNFHPQFAAKEGLKTRDWKEVRIAKLQLMVR
jgi:hypothetical protein